MRFSFILILVLFQSTIYSQNNDQGIVLYGHKQSLGLGGPFGVDYNGLLVFNKYSASYTFAKDSLEGGHISKIVNYKNEDKVSIIKKNSNRIGFIYFQNRKENIFKSRDLGFSYVKQNIPEIKWSISSKTKTIGNYKCLMATAEFSGRNYTAWFTTAIPLPFGPWKLQGLPGLILEAYDTNKEIYFYFKSLEYPSNNKSYIIVPDPKNEGKQWMSFTNYKTMLLNAFELSIQNGRLVSEQNELSVIDRKKPTMRDSYIEVFDQ